MNPLAASKRICHIIASALIALALSSCVNVRPVVVTDRTLPPATAAVTVPPSPEGTPYTTLEQTATPAPVFDLKGNRISGAEHFKRYLSLHNVQVYEQEGDTFVDAIILNDYPQTIVCAAGVLFNDENGELVAEGRLQTRDAQYILILPPGETTLFAQVDTDMTLTDLALLIVFDDSLGVKPEE